MTQMMTNFPKLSLASEASFLAILMLLIIGATIWSGYGEILT